jgi:hypothetical protein
MDRCYSLGMMNNSCIIASSCLCLPLYNELLNMLLVGCHGSGQGPVEGSCEHGDNEPSGSIRQWQFLSSWKPVASPEALLAVEAAA